MHQTAELVTLPRESKNGSVVSVFGTNDLSVFQTPLDAKVPGFCFGTGVMTQRPAARGGRRGEKGGQAELALHLLANSV